MGMITNTLIAAIIINASCCFVGEYANIDGTCRQCDISCNTCKSSDGCSTCFDQMYLTTRGNLVVCDVCYRVNKGCAVCLTASKCSTCSNGYSLQDDNTCISCSSMFPHCMLCTNSNSTFQCIACSTPYLLANGECVLNSNSGGKNGQETSPVANAMSANSEDPSIMASPCDANQVQVNGNCYASIPFCQSYSQSNGQCLNCISIFVLNNGSCMPSALVLNRNPSTPTQNGPSSSPASDSSVSLPPNCLAANPAVPSQCQQCMQGFAIIDGYPGVCTMQN